MLPAVGVWVGPGHPSRLVFRDSDPEEAWKQEQHLENFGSLASFHERKSLCKITAIVITENIQGSALKIFSQDSKGETTIA